MREPVEAIARTGLHQLSDLLLLERASIESPAEWPSVLLFPIRTAVTGRKHASRHSPPIESAAPGVYAAGFSAFAGSRISTFRTFASGRAGSGTLTSSTPSANVAFTSSSLTPSGRGTAR